MALDFIRSKSSIGKTILGNIYKDAKKTSFFFLSIVTLYTVWVVMAPRHFTSQNTLIGNQRLFALNTTSRNVSLSPNIHLNITVKNIEKTISNASIYSNLTNIISQKTDNMTCLKAKNVAFLKIHKAGSSTVMNIFLRYGIENDLNFVLPNTLSGTFNYLGNFVTLKRERVIPLPANQTYNLLCNHVVYNHEAFAQFMPNDTVYIGIIRDPVTRFLSAGSYFNAFRPMKQMTGVETNDLDLLLTKFFESDINRNNKAFAHINNKMAYDYGMPEKDFQNVNAINVFLKKLSLEVPFVMVLEYLDESIILMKRYLCWALKDVLYISLNTSGKNKSNIFLNNATREKIKDWNKADSMLYEYFHERFWEQVKEEGLEFFSEVDHFKQTRKEVVEFCKHPKKGNELLNVAASIWNPSFSVSRIDCKMMMTQELNMVTTLIKSAFLKINMRIDESGLYYADTNEKVQKPIHA